MPVSPGAIDAAWFAILASTLAPLARLRQRARGRGVAADVRAGAAEGSKFSSAGATAQNRIARRIGGCLLIAKNSVVKSEFSCALGRRAKESVLDIIHGSGDPTGDGNASLSAKVESIDVIACSRLGYQIAAL